MQLTIEQQNKIRELRHLLKKNAPLVYDLFAAKKLNDNGIVKEIKGSAHPLLSNTHGIGSESNKSLTVAAQLD